MRHFIFFILSFQNHVFSTHSISPVLASPICLAATILNSSTLEQCLANSRHKYSLNEGMFSQEEAAMA